MVKLSFLFFVFLLGPRVFAANSEPTSPSPRPDKINDEGDYLYKATSSKEAIYYKVDHLPPIKGALYVRFGKVGPYEITGDSGRTFQQMYSDKSSFVMFVEYERYLGQLLGKWTMKLGSGLTTETGNGRFVSDTTQVPKEKFNFFIFPNTALLNYKIKFSDTQLFTPYFEGGAGYFTFVEYRTDGGKTNLGGAGVLAVGGGLLISMNILDKNAAGIMYEDYGINHLWLDLQFRRYEGLDKQKDFSSNMATAGFGFAF